MLVSLQASRIVIYKINGGLACLLLLLLADVFHEVDLGPGALVAMGQHDSPDLVALFDYLIQDLVVVVHPYCMQCLHLGRLQMKSYTVWSLFGSKSHGSRPKGGGRTKSGCSSSW